MTARDTGSEVAWQSSPELLVLHAVRLAGFGDTGAIAERVPLADAAAADAFRGLVETLRDLEGQGLVERMAFAGAGGWILTEAGQARVAAGLRDEREVSGAEPVLARTIEAFEDVNARLVRTVTQWQLQSPADRAGHRAAIVRELADLAGALDGLMAGLAGRLPRFGRYPRQFSAAVEQARAGDDDWVAGVGRLSCHTVWAELHQDLLSSLGRERSPCPRGNGR